VTQRTVVILLATLAVLALLTVIGQRSRAPVSDVGAPIIPGLETAVGDLERVALVGAGGQPIATLERRTETWVVAEKNGYAADIGKLRENLRQLAEARILETKTANTAFYDRLGVQDIADAEAAGVAVSFTAPGAELPTLILGDTEGTNYRYARRAGEAQSFLIDRAPDFPRNASQWLVAKIIDVRGPRIQQITITHPDGEVVTVSKLSADAMYYDVAAIPAGRELLYPGVASVIGNALRELNLEDVEPADAVPAESPVQVEFRTFDGLVVRAVGSKRADQAWVSFEASFDAEQAARFAAAAPAAEPPVSQPPAATSDVAAEAGEINRTVGGWRYRIAGFQYDQMTRRMADLLKPPA
jgi:hypothetical protein